MEFESLIGDFASEALDLIERLEGTLLSLEGAGEAERVPLLGAARRCLHTLKGNAGMVGASALRSAFHAMEDLAEGSVTDPERVAKLLAGVDVVRAEVRALASGRAVNEVAPAVHDLIAGLLQARGESAEAPVLSGELRLPQQRVDQLVAMAGELVVQNRRLQRLLAEAAPDRRALRDGGDQLDQTIRLLHEQILRVRTVPVGRLLARFRRLVRDEARAHGKRAELRIVGAEIEADKEILDRLGGALVHLVRNAVVHGIEPPAERAAAGKPETGEIVFTAAPSGGHIALSVADDGRGLDEQAILERARERGLDPSIGAAALAFEPGFSTASLSESAGRGVGLDVVQRCVYGCGGTVELAWRPGQGTRITVRVPTSIALQRALLCELCGETYALPVANVLQAARLGEGEVRWLGAGQALEHRGRLVPIVDSQSLLGLAQTRGDYAVLVQAGSLAALRVDRLLGQQDFVFQPLEPSLYGSGPASAGALLGDGRVVLRLDPETLVASSARPSQAHKVSP